MTIRRCRTRRCFRAPLSFQRRRSSCCNVWSEQRTRRHGSCEGVRYVTTFVQEPASIIGNRSFMKCLRNRGTIRGKKPDRCQLTGGRLCIAQKKLPYLIFRGCRLLNWRRIIGTRTISMGQSLKMEVVLLLRCPSVSHLLRGHKLLILTSGLSGR